MIRLFLLCLLIFELGTIHSDAKRINALQASAPPTIRHITRAGAQVRLACLGRGRTSTKRLRCERHKP